jgi:hypothetical protein
MIFIEAELRHGSEYAKGVYTFEDDTITREVMVSLLADQVYPSTFSLANRFHQALWNDLATKGKGSLGWIDYRVLQPVTERKIAEELVALVAVAGDGLDHVPTTTLAEDGQPAISIFVEDLTAPNGQREFIVEVRRGAV